MTRNYVIFLFAVAALVFAVPFADRKDWQGWMAYIVIFAAIAWMAGRWLYTTTDSIREWWHDRS